MIGDAKHCFFWHQGSRPGGGAIFVRDTAGGSEDGNGTTYTKAPVVFFGRQISRNPVSPHHGVRDAVDEVSAMPECDDNELDSIAVTRVRAALSPSSFSIVPRCRRAYVRRALSPPDCGCS